MVDMEVVKKNIRLFVNCLVVFIICGLVYAFLIQPPQKTDKIYAGALELVQKNEYSKAYFEFSKVIFSSPLKPLAIYHQAVCANKIEDYDGAVKKYRLFLLLYPRHTLATKVKYNLAQALLDKDPLKAKKYFESIINQSPNSDYAIASEYYAGLLMLKEYENQKIFPLSVKNDIENHFRHYLKQAPSGRLALNVIENWNKIDKNISKDDYLLMAKSYYLFRDYKNAETYAKKADLKNGIADIYVDSQIFFRIIALNKPEMDLKGLILENIGLIVFDEFICNPRKKEKYLPNEAFSFKTLYDTFSREYDGTLPCIFMGNPYSLFNPYFADLGIDVKKLELGTIYAPKGENYVVEWYKMTPELYEYLKAKDPFFKDGDDYTEFALKGVAINDKNVYLVDKQPSSFILKLGVMINGKMIGIYVNTSYERDYYIWVGKIDTISSRKRVFCFDFEDIQNGTILMTREDRFLFSGFKNAFRSYSMAFQDIECYYYSREVYQNL